MARIRNISPRFFEDEKVAALPFGARLLFIGLWTRCDMRGVIEWNIKIISAALFPYDENISADQVASWLAALTESGMVISFEASGKRWGFVPHFSDHQSISKAERDYDAKSKVRYPNPPGSRSSNHSGIETGTVTETVIETVTVTVPETTGHRTKDIGRRTEDAVGARGAPPPPPSADPMFDGELPPAQITQAPRPKNLGDFQSMYGRIHIGRDERDAWQAMINLWTYDACVRAYQAIVPTLTDSKHRVLLSMMTKWLDDHLELTPEDLARASR